MIREIQYSDFIEEKPCVKDRIDDRGREVLDTTPVSIPIMSAPAPSSIIQLIHQLYRDMHDAEYETFADADNFDCEEELGIEMRSTPYEQDFDHLESAPPAPGTPEKDPAVDSGGGESSQE